MFGDILKGHNITKDTDEKVKYGVRIFKVSDKRLLIKQTIKKGHNQNDPYVIDGQKERHVKISDDTAIADGVRDGVSGQLTTGRK